MVGFFIWGRVRARREQRERNHLAFLERIITCSTPAPPTLCVFLLRSSRRGRAPPGPPRCSHAATARHPAPAPAAASGR